MIKQATDGQSHRSIGRLLQISFAIALSLIVGCSSSSQDTSPSVIRIVATTTVRDSGLLEPWMEWAERESGVPLEVLAMSSGQAADLVEKGEVDLVLLHAPAIEQSLIDNDLIDRHQLVMQNDFVLVGPSSDPAGIGQETDWTLAMKKIADTEARFVSRGDRSGTHQREEELWKEAGVEPGTWRSTTGLGQAETLRVANEMQAYAIIDHATLVTHRSLIELVEFKVQGEFSKNEYRLMIVGEKHRVATDSAVVQQLYELLVSKESKAWIDAFGQDEHGESIFQSL